MKKNIKLFGLLLMAGMAFTACSSDDIEGQANSQQENKTWTAMMDVAKGLDTRTLTLSGTSLNVGWNTSEKVYVYRSNELVGTLSPSTITTSTSVSMTGTLDGNTYAVGNPVTLRFPREEVDYTGQDGTLATIAAKYDYALGSTTVKSVSGNSVTFNTATLISQQAIVKFTFPWAVKMVSVYGSEDVLDEPIVVLPTTAISTVYVALPMAESAVASYVVTAVRASDNRETVVKKTGVLMQNGKYYTCAFTESDMATPTYFNLGLSVNWCAYNLDLTSTSNSKLTVDVTKDGSRFAWGETKTKDTGYSMNTYKFYNTTTGKYTKYVNSSNHGTVDNLTVLQLTDDAARAANSNYRMPTEQEAQELFDSNKCFRTQYNMDGEYYTIVTSKISGREGNAIIFRTGNDQYLWTSTLGGTTPNAVGFSMNGNEIASFLSLYRPYDYQIRPVRP